MHAFLKPSAVLIGPPCSGHLAFPLQALYPGTGGVAPTLARPVILLIVRQKRRGLARSDDVRIKSDSMRVWYSRRGRGGEYLTTFGVCYLPRGT